MTYSVIIPAHNEQDFIGITLQSLLNQTVLPLQVIVVNDNSTDNTPKIIDLFTQKNSWISSLSINSSTTHQPGSKVINAFLKGYKNLEYDFDIIVKLDADLELPVNYFETIINHFKSDTQIGMVGGFAYIQKNGQWVLENLTDKEHIRGAFKAYRKACYTQIGGLQPAMGWDTADELVAKYYGWKVVTDKRLQVKHLKPTGANYAKQSSQLQGEAFYTLGYGVWLTTIASLKLAFLKQNISLFFNYMKGFWFAKKSNKKLLVTKEQALFIRNYRWKKIKNKLFFF